MVVVVVVLVDMPLITYTPVFLLVIINDNCNKNLKTISSNLYFIVIMKIINTIFIHIMSFCILTIVLMFLESRLLSESVDSGKLQGILKLNLQSIGS